jgi:endoglucanase
MKKIYLLLLSVALCASSFSQNTLPFGVNLSGAEFGENFPGKYNADYTYPNAEELDYYKSKGLTLIRLPFKWERIQPELGGALDMNELNRMKIFIDLCNERNMLVIPDMHNYARRNMDGSDHIIGSPSLSIGHIADAWKKISAELKSKKNIWGYGIMNEPHDMLSSTPWFSIAQGIINKIREADLKTPVIVGGDSWSSAERWMALSDTLKYLVDPAKNLIFEAHVYFDANASGGYRNSYENEKASPETGINRVAPFIKWLNENKFRGFIGEYGVPADDPRWLIVLDKFLNHLQENCINGTYWAGGPWWREYKLSSEPKDGVDKPQMSVLDKYKNANKKCY